MASRITSLCRVLALLFVSSALFAQSAKPQHAHISLVAAPHNSGSHWIGLRFQLDPGWHIYWINPGDSGEPPKVTWHLPSGFQAADLQFPAPHRIADHGLTDYGYEGEAVLLAKLTVPANATSNNPEIAADVRYLVCREVCIPGKDRVSVNLSGAQEASVIQAAQARLPESLPPGVRIRAAAETKTLVLWVSGQSSKLGQITDFIPADEQVIDNSAKPEIAKSGATTQVRLKKSEQLDHSVTELRGLLITRDKAYNVAAPIAATKRTSQESSAPKQN